MQFCLEGLNWKQRCDHLPVSSDAEASSTEAKVAEREEEISHLRGLQHVFQSHMISCPAIFQLRITHLSPDDFQV